MIKLDARWYRISNKYVVVCRNIRIYVLSVFRLWFSNLANVIFTSFLSKGWRNKSKLNTEVDVIDLAFIAILVILWQNLKLYVCSFVYSFFLSISQSIIKSCPQIFLKNRIIFRSYFYDRSVIRSIDRSFQYILLHVKCTTDWRIQK